MNAHFDPLPILLKAGAAGQFLVALVNLSIARLLYWRKDIAAMPLLLREVFQVHVWFITITLMIFATVTWRFADGMRDDPAARWLAGGIAIFWGIRTVIQIGYYSPSHWRGKKRETAIHIILLIAYGGLALVYGATALIGLIGD